MSWVLESEEQANHCRNAICQVLKAELRQLWWLSPATLGAGLGIWLLLLIVTADVSISGRADDTVFNYLASLVFSVTPVMLVASGLARTENVGRVRLWRSLPLSRTTVNRLRIFTLAIHLWPTLLTWPLIIHLLAGVYGPVTGWVFIFTGLLLVVCLFLSFRTSLAAFLLYMVIILPGVMSNTVPALKELTLAWADLVSRPWPSLCLLAITIIVGLRIFSTRPSKAFAFFFTEFVRTMLGP